MQGSIRFFVGLLLTIGGVGGIEQSLTDAGLLVGLAWSLLGCAIMWWGVRAMPQSSLR